MRTLLISLFFSIVATTTWAQQTLSVPTPPEQREALTQGLEDKKWYPATGKDLLALIEGCEEASCMSYVAGLLNGLATRQFIMGEDNPFCAGDQISSRDIRDALVTVISRDEELQRQPVALGVIATFSVTWPCQGTVDPLANIPEEEQFSVSDMTALDPGSILTVFENYPGALTLGNLVAPTVQTIVVFHDPNCRFCEDFKRETNVLANTGWKVIILPVGILGENSLAYSAVMYAFSETRADFVEALYRNGTVGEASVEQALEIANEFDISASEVLGEISRTNAYESVTANNQLMGLLGAEGTPSWLISDFMVTGIVDAQKIIRAARDIPVPPGEVGFDRPGIDSPRDLSNEPLILPETGNSNN